MNLTSLSTFLVGRLTHPVYEIHERDLTHPLILAVEPSYKFMLRLLTSDVPQVGL